jgi:hypothetical protein
MNRLILQFQTAHGTLPEKIRHKILESPVVDFEGADYSHGWCSTKDPLVFVTDTIFRQDVVAEILGTWIRLIVAEHEGVSYTLSEVLCTNDPELGRPLP